MDAEKRKKRSTNYVDEDMGLRHTDDIFSFRTERLFYTEWTDINFSCRRKLTKTLPNDSNVLQRRI